MTRAEKRAAWRLLDAHQKRLGRGRVGRVVAPPGACASNPRQGNQMTGRRVRRFILNCLPKPIRRWVIRTFMRVWYRAALRGHRVWN